MVAKGDAGATPEVEQALASRGFDVRDPWRPMNAGAGAGGTSMGSGQARASTPPSQSTRDTRTKYSRAYKQQNCVSHGSKHQQVGCSESPLPRSSSAVLLLSPHVVEGARDLSGALL